MHQKTETPKVQSVAEESTKESTEVKPYLSLQEALMVIGHLQARKLLCQACGYRIATNFNQAYDHCDKCKKPNMTYGTYGAQVKRGSDFERFLCTRLEQYAEYLLSTGASPTGA